MKIETTIDNFGLEALRRADKTGLLDIAGDVNAMEALTTLVSDCLDSVDRAALETNTLVVDGGDTVH